MASIGRQSVTSSSAGYEARIQNYKRDASDIRTTDERVSEALSAGELLQDTLREATPDMAVILQDIASQCKSDENMLQGEATLAVESGRMEDFAKISNALEELSLARGNYESWKRNMQNKHTFDSVEKRPSSNSFIGKTTSASFANHPSSIVGGSGRNSVIHSVSSNQSKSIRESSRGDSISTQEKAGFKTPPVITPTGGSNISSSASFRTSAFGSVAQGIQKPITQPQVAEPTQERSKYLGKLKIDPNVTQKETRNYANTKELSHSKANMGHIPPPKTGSVISPSPSMNFSSFSSVACPEEQPILDPTNDSHFAQDPDPFGALDAWNAFSPPLGDFGADTVPQTDNGAFHEEGNVKKSKLKTKTKKKSKNKDMGESIDTTPSVDYTAGGFNEPPKDPSVQETALTENPLSRSGSAQAARLSTFSAGTKPDSLIAKSMSPTENRSRVVSYDQQMPVFEEVDSPKQNRSMKDFIEPSTFNPLKAGYASNASSINASLHQTNDFSNISKPEIESPELSMKSSSNLTPEEAKKRIQALEYKLQCAEVTIRPKIEAEILSDVSNDVRAKTRTYTASLDEANRRREDLELWKTQAEKKLDEAQLSVEQHKEKYDKLKQAVDEREKLMTHAKEMWLKESTRASKLSEALNKAEERIAELENEIHDVNEKYTKAAGEAAQLRRFLMNESEVEHPSGTSGDQASHFQHRHSRGDVRGPISESMPPNTLALLSEDEAELRGLEARPTDEANLNRFRQLVVRDDAVLYEDDSIQIGLKSDFVGLEGKLVLFFGNKNNSVLQNFDVQCVFNEPGLTAVVSSHVPSLVNAGQQLCQEVNLCCSGPFLNPPVIIVKFLLSDNSPRLLSLKLPVVVSKFMKGQDLSAQQFNRAWNEEHVAQKEVAAFVSFSRALKGQLGKIAVAAELGGALTLLHDGARSKDDLLLAGVFPPLRFDSTHDQTLVLVLLRTGYGQFRSAGRLMVRSESPQLSTAVRNVLIRQLGTLSFSADG